MVKNIILIICISLLFTGCGHIKDEEVIDNGRFVVVEKVS